MGQKNVSFRVQLILYSVDFPVMRFSCSESERTLWPSTNICSLENKFPKISVSETETLSSLCQDALIKYKPPFTFLFYLQDHREASREWRDHRAVSRGKAGDGRGEGAARCGLHLLWVATPLHHRHPLWSWFLHLFWHPLQSRRGHRQHGQ